MSNNHEKQTEEIKRLRIELAEMTQSRDRLRELIRAILPMDSVEITEARVQEMMRQPLSGIDDVIGELLQGNPVFTAA